MVAPVKPRWINMPAVPAVLAVLTVLASMLITPAASALNPATPLQDYHHTTWTVKDGAPTNIDSMAQTSDGWLWLSSKSGLHRFDGVRFERYTLPRSGQPLRRRPTSLRALPNGDLLVSYFLGGGLSVLHPDGSLEDLAEPGKGIDPLNGLTDDGKGNIWLAARTGLHHYSDGKWRTLGAAQGLPAGQIEDVKFDRYGRLWALSAYTVFLYKQASGKFEKVRDLPGISTMLESPDGRMWVADFHGVQSLPAPAPATAPAAPSGRAVSFNNAPGYFDRDGNLWSFKCPVGLCLTANAGNKPSGRIVPERDATSRFDQPWQMSSLNLNIMLEDREGNIWIATKTGLERFRDTRLTPVHVPDSRGVFSLSLDSEGQVWAVDPDTNTAWQVAANRPPVADRTQRYRVSTIDRDGALLLATDAEIERRYQGKVEKIPLPAPKGPDGKPVRMVVWGLQDNGHVLFMMSPQTGLMGWSEGRWRPRRDFKLPPMFVIGTPGQPGESWLALTDGTIMHYSEQQQPSYQAGMIGLATGMFAGEHVIAAGDKGIAVFKDKAFHQLSAANPDVLLNISGMAVTSNGDRWLNGEKGLLQVRKADWLASMADPSLPLRYALLSVHDGYRGEAQLDNRLPSMLADKDDRLWISGSGGLMWLDTRNIQRNLVAPVVEVPRIVMLDESSYAGKGKLTLPAGARSFNIHYTAPSLRQPENVRFQYRLLDEDKDWQDAGTRRSVLYTSMTPGAYRFEVRAANEDGVWSARPAMLEFDIPATFTQTLWFKAACALAAVAALYLLYLYRLRIITARLEERLEVRLAERERIARTLHDTFLQTVQGVVLRLDAAVDSLPDDSSARKTLEPVLHSARHGINEGRAQVHELRTGDADELESRLREVASLVAASYPGVQFILNVEGERRALRAGAVDEISEIGREAVRNAYQHAQATRIDVLLNYGDGQFTLQVRDNGKGMAPAPTAAAPAGHWGLVGMRERAARIGAALLIDSAQENGSTITIALSARKAYAARRPWWRGLFGI